MTALVVAAVVPPLAAQTDGRDGRFHYGAIFFTPSIALTDFGLDSNVFNESDAPKSDLTGTVQPSLDAGLRIGASRLTWTGQGSLSFFRRYSDQGTLGGSHRARLDVPINRLRLFLSHGLVNAKDRPTPEIDVRVRRREQSASAGADLQLTTLTRLTGSVDTGLVRFEQSGSELTAAIARALDRQSDRVTASLTHAITPLTSLVATYSVQRERFIGDALRNNLNSRGTLGFSFKPLALVSGRIEGGVLQFASEDARVAGLTAPAVSADLGYVFKGTTHFTARADRTVSYSIDDASAFYLQTSFGGGVRHHLTDSVSVALSAARQSLAHELTGLGAAPVDGVAPLTRVNLYDAGLGYAMSNGIRWGLHGTYTYRKAIGGSTPASVVDPVDLPGPVGLRPPRFENLRVFLSVSYGSS